MASGNRVTPHRPAHTGHPQAVAHLLQAGLEHHHATRLEEAAACYRKILALQGTHPDALNLLGVIARERGELGEAEQFIGKALRANPRSALYHYHLGRTHLLQGREGEAIACFRHSLALNQHDADSMIELAQALGRKAPDPQCLSEAIELLRKVLKQRPEVPEIYFHLGHLLQISGKGEEQLAVLRQSSERFPGSALAQLHLANAFAQSGHAREAVETYERVLKLNPEQVDAYVNLGTILQDRGEGERARLAYFHALRLNPECVQGLSNLGVLYLDRGETRRAEAVLRRALELAPHSLEVAKNLTGVLIAQGRTLEAIEHFQKVLQREPKSVAALCTLGFLFDGLGDDESAKRSYQLARLIEPNSPTVLFNLGIHALLDGNFAEGLPAYELRWHLRDFAERRRFFPSPRWQGEPLAGKTLFAFSEQGFGDTLQYVRFLPALVASGARVLLEVQPALLRLLQNFHPEIHVFPQGEMPPDHDRHTALMSLPLRLGVDLGELPAATPYIHADAAAAARWAERIRTPAFRVGVVWSGNPKHTRDHMRSLPFAEFERILDLEGVAFFSLQIGPGAAQAQEAFASDRMKDLAPDLHDFSDTAAAITQLDLVIAVDTAVVHLAGAMGKPVWILLPTLPDWRWLRARSDSPWYPTARLFRQERTRDWSGVIDAVGRELASAAAGKRTAE